ncbi:hypothetical protein RKD20_006142 [Streptomyces sp. SLBN-8D4]|jgi:hypothetical protein
MSSTEFQLEDLTEVPGTDVEAALDPSRPTGSTATAASARRSL